MEILSKIYVFMILPERKKWIVIFEIVARRNIPKVELRLTTIRNEFSMVVGLAVARNVDRKFRGLNYHWLKN